MTFAIFSRAAGHSWQSGSALLRANSAFSSSSCILYGWLEGSSGLNNRSFLAFSSLPPLPPSTLHDAALCNGLNLHPRSSFPYKSAAAAEAAQSSGSVRIRRSPLLPLKSGDSATAVRICSQWRGDATETVASARLVSRQGGRGIRKDRRRRATRLRILHSSWSRQRRRHSIKLSTCRR